MKTATLHYLMLAGLVVGWSGCQPWRANDALPARAGDDCSANVQCGAGLLCSRGGTCEAAGSVGTLGNGANCQEDAECQSDFVCNSRGQCRRPQNLGEDETCLLQPIAVVNWSAAMKASVQQMVKWAQRQTATPAPVKQTVDSTDLRDRRDLHLG